jgi:hypothetical protein
MKVYTYFEEIRFQNQSELLKLWEESWHKQGFSPVILSRLDASKSADYQNFDSELRAITLKITNKSITKYETACFMRWLAFSTQKEEMFYVSDYDVINHSFKPIEPINKLHFMDGVCPCLVSGKPSQFRIFCQDLISMWREDPADYIQKYKHYNLKGFHDQGFLALCFEKLNKKNYAISKNRDNGLLGTPKYTDFLSKQLIHYGSYPTSIYCQKNNLQFDSLQKFRIAEKHFHNL